jgi:hypothetical protein
MSIDWRPNMSIAEYIARKKYQPARPHAHITESTTSQVNKATSTRPEPHLLAASLALELKRDQYLGDGTMEMQCSLLRQLARQENTAKGLMNKSVKLTPGEYQFESKKGELAQVLYTIWGLQDMNR